MATSFSCASNGEAGRREGRSGLAGLRRTGLLIDGAACRRVVPVTPQLRRPCFKLSRGSGHPTGRTAVQQRAILRDRTRDQELRMTQHRFAIGLMAVNLLLIVLVAAQAAPGATPQDVLRGRALELVDERGQVRATLDVDETGEVLLRLRDRNGTIRVKLGAAEHGSGLLLVDDATAPAIQIIARQTPTASRPGTTSITLRGPGTQPNVIRP